MDAQDDRRAERIAARAAHRDASGYEGLRAAIAQAATEVNALDSKTEELIAVAVAIRCDNCIAVHAKAALEQGASREEVLGCARYVYVAAGPAVM